MMKKAAGILCCFYLAGCTTLSRDEISIIEKLEQYEQATFHFELTPITEPDVVLDEASVRDLSIKAWQAGVEQCSVNFFSEFPQLEFNPVETSKRLQSDFARCAKLYGVDAVAVAKPKNGEILEFPIYVENFLGLTEQVVKDQIQRDIDQQARNDFINIFLLSLSGSLSQSVNPGIHTVSPHTKANGTSVAPYYRTNPNQYCYDNLRGCR